MSIYNNDPPRPAKMKNVLWAIVIIVGIVLGLGYLLQPEPAEAQLIAPVSVFREASGPCAPYAKIREKVVTFTDFTADIRGSDKIVAGVAQRAQEWLNKHPSITVIDHKVNQDVSALEMQGASKMVVHQIFVYTITIFYKR